MSAGKKWRGWLWSVLLASRSLRRRLAWHLLHRYPADLDARVPLGENLSSPLFDAEFGVSFAEIFLQQEYAPLLDSVAPPRRWIDLGCYAGFFSLWLERQRRRVGDSATPSQALLVDANAALQSWLQRLIAMNGLDSHWTFCHGAIAEGRGDCDFVERSYMESSLGGVDPAPGLSRRVPVLAEEELLRIFPPPYDLLKADIEGAEYDLLRHYPRVIEQSRCLCLEWHSWQAGGGGVAQLCRLAEELGLRLDRELQPARTLPGGKQTGVLLFVNPRFSPAHAVA